MFALKCRPRPGGPGSAPVTRPAHCRCRRVVCTFPCRCLFRETIMRLLINFYRPIRLDVHINQHAYATTRRATRRPLAAALVLELDGEPVRRLVLRVVFAYIRSTPVISFGDAIDFQMRRAWLMFGTRVLTFRRPAPCTSRTSTPTFDIVFVFHYRAAQ